MTIEVYDPLEIIEEPILPEPPGKFGILPSPSGSFKDKKRNFRKLMPNRDILILGTVPRNVVNLEFLEKKRVSKQDNDNEVITIDKYIKNKRLNNSFIMKDKKMRKTNSFYKKRQSQLFHISIVDKHTNVNKETGNLRPTVSEEIKHEFKSLNNSLDNSMPFLIEEVNYTLKIDGKK